MRNKKIGKNILLSLFILVIASLIGIFFYHLEFPDTTIVLIYLTGILLIARFAEGYWYGIISSLVAIFAFNFFFTEPYYTFAVNDPSYLITFFVMILTSFITSALTSQVIQNTKEAKEKEEETKALYHLVNHLTDAASYEEIKNIAEQGIKQAIGIRCSCIFGKENEIPKSEDNVSDWSIIGQQDFLGVVRFGRKEEAELGEVKKRLLQSMIESIALALDRLFVLSLQQQNRQEIEQERYRSNLLRAISHDLRTPLSGIMGTSEMILAMTEIKDERYVLAQGIYKDARWLHSLVENILSLTKLQDGRLIPNKQPEVVEEIIGAAVQLVTARMPEREIIVKVPEELLFVPMDAKLIMQVLVNLLDNASKHTPLDREILVQAEKERNQKGVIFIVLDRGEGIKEKDLPNIFQMFYTTIGKSADMEAGVGLGLSICEAIVKAHGGTIWAENRKDGPGAKFSFLLPFDTEEKKKKGEKDAIT